MRRLTRRLRPVAQCNGTWCKGRRVTGEFARRGQPLASIMAKDNTRQTKNNRQRYNPSGNDDDRNRNNNNNNNNNNNKATTTTATAATFENNPLNRLCTAYVSLLHICVSLCVRISASCWLTWVGRRQSRIAKGSAKR